MLLLIWCFLLVSAIVTSSTTNEKDICSLCDCSAKILDCSNRNISIMLPLERHTNVTTVSFNINLMTSVPVLPKLSVKILLLAHNKITNIEDSAFKNLASMVVLDLSDNSLTADTLLPNIFRGDYAPDFYEPLRNLKEINIAYNVIHALHPNLFEHVPKLEKLNLKGNPLRIISYGTILAISCIPLLKELDLSETELKNLPESLLHAPKKLEILDLSNNQFTSPPAELANSHQIRWLSLTGNPINIIIRFPSMQFLRILHLNKMKDLIKIEGRSLSTLPKLEEFYCSENNKLVKIDKTAFSALENAEEGEGEVWPPLNVIVLNNNSLHSIDKHLIGRWDHLTVIDLQNNPWMCDCENQWLVSTLTPMIEAKQPELLKSFTCQSPVKYRGTAIITLEKEDLCKIDKSWSTSRKALVGFFIIILIVIVTSAQTGIAYYKRTIKNQTVRYQIFNDNSRSCNLPHRLKYDMMFLESIPMNIVH